MPSTRRRSNPQRPLAGAAPVASLALLLSATALAPRLMAQELVSDLASGLTAELYPATASLMSRPEVTLDSIERVAAAAGAERNLDVQVLHWSDGTHTVISREYNPREARRAQALTESVEFRIDLARGEYDTAVVSGDPGIQLDMPEIYAPQGGEIESHSAAGTTPPSGGTHLKWRIETWEPARYVVPVSPLTITLMELQWSFCTPTDIQVEFFTHRCMANPQTFIYTTWYNDSCQPTLSTSSSNKHASVAAQYHNWDFGLPYSITQVSEALDVNVFSGGSYMATHAWHASGDFSWFLSGVTRKEEAMVYNACPNGSGPGGGAPGLPSGGNGSEVCVPVYNGTTGGYLGHCCGYTTPQILDCAADYL